MKRKKDSQPPYMEVPQSNPSDRLKSARLGNDPAILAEALAAHASKLVQEGKIGFARAEIDEAIQIHQNLSRVYDEARLTQLSATLCRMEGNFQEAKTRAVRAANLADAINNPALATPIIVGAATELGETALSQGDGLSAAYAFGQAYEIGKNGGLLPTYQSSILRKRAAAYAQAGKPDDAVADLEIAYRILKEEGDKVNAIRTLIEQISALMQSTQANSESKIDTLMTEARIAAGETEDHASLADLDILVATQALQKRDSDTALIAAKSARQEALAGRAPLAYISSIAVIAQLEENAGNRVAAYGALATGWATLGDLLGPQVARATFEPLLQQMRDRWGNTHFWEVKESYENMRRAALEIEKSHKEISPIKGADKQQ